MGGKVGNQAKAVRYINVAGLVLTLGTIIFAVIWAFPLYWAVITTLKPEDEVVRPYIELWPDTFTFRNYVHILVNTKIGIWYLNSIVISLGVTVITILMGATCGYAISQLRFPGRTLLWWTILASFMVPIQALIINHFVIIAGVKLLNTLARASSSHADPSDRRHRLQAVLRFGAARLQRSGGPRRRERIPASVLDLPPDELGGDDRARDHHLHRGVERVSLAVPRSDIAKTK